jgi:hypothetical protein
MLPSPLTILAAVIVVFFVVLTVVRGPIDADFWWHLATGRLILDSGSVPTTDPFSFAYDGPWVAHEWLGEVLIAALVDGVGFPITAALFGLTTAATLIVPAVALHRSGVAVRALAPWLAIGAFTLASFATVRPQVLSWLLLSGLLVLLISLRAEDRYRPWLVVPLMLAWANLHGLWVVGLGVIGVYVAFTLVGRTPLASRRWTAVGMVVGSVAASALTPAGPAGLLYPLRYLRQDDWGTAFIAEWQGADFTDPRQWGVALLIVGVLLLGRRATSAWLAVVAVLGLAAAVIAVRNAPLAVVMSMPMLATALHAWLGPLREVTTARARQRRLLEMGAAAAVIVAMLFVIPSAAAGSEETAFPVAVFDRLDEVAPDARLLVDYDWAGYAIHRLHEGGGSVFIDGRSDMYPREIFEDYLALRSAQPGWERLADEYGVEAILLPSAAPLVGAARDAGWCEEHADTRSTLLVAC